MEIDLKHYKHMMMEIDDDNEDRISQLPNSVLTLILSSLKVREAVRTSAISSRWIHLFKCPTSLLLDANNMLERDKYSDINVSQMQCTERFLVKMKRTLEFMDNVDYYLYCVREVQKIEKLKVHFTFGDDRYAHRLNQWIGFALERGVEDIDLCLLEEDHFSAPIKGLYFFPCGLLAGISSLRSLRLAHCVLAPGPQRFEFSGFTTLTSLELMMVDLVFGDRLQNLLWNCRDIESLSFSMCENLHSLRIEHPLCQKLKYLNVNNCPLLKAIELKGLNVETLEYKGGIIQIQFHNTPRLRTVLSGMSDWRLSYGDIWPLSRLPLDLPQIETLVLETTCHMAGSMFIPTFPNLQHLVILKLAKHEHELSWIATILEACPKLQRLELHLRTNSYVEEELEDINRPRRCPHSQLKEVLITGMSGYKSEIETAIYLLENATSLQKMKIDPRPRLYLGNAKWHHLEPCESWTRTGKNKLHHHLTQVHGPVQPLIL